MTLRMLALCSLVASSAFADENGAGPPRPLDSAAAARGRRDYERYCVWCHGEREIGRAHV